MIKGNLSILGYVNGAPVKNLHCAKNVITKETNEFKIEQFGKTAENERTM